MRASQTTYHGITGDQPVSMCVQPLNGGAAVYLDDVGFFGARKDNATLDQSTMYSLACLAELFTRALDAIEQEQQKYTEKLVR